MLTTSGRTIFRAAGRTHLDGIRDRFLAHLDDDQLVQLWKAWWAIDTTSAPDPGHADGLIDQRSRIPSGMPVMLGQ